MSLLRVRIPSVALAIALLAFYAGVGRAQTLSFSVTALGNFGTDATLATGGIANNGTVAGTSYSADGTPTAVTWTSGGGFTSLGLNVGAQTSIATAISPDGTYILGTTFVPGPEDSIATPYRWSSGDGALAIPFEIYGVNNSGVVVGRKPDGDFQATTWTAAGGTEMITNSGGAAFGLNASGVVVGTIASSGHQVAFRYTAGEGFTSLGTLGGNDSFAQRINAAGTIAGWSNTADSLSHLFSWTSDGGMVDLGAYTSPNVTGLNASGDILFTAFDEGLGSVRSYYHKAGTTYALVTYLADAGLLADPNKDIVATGLNDSGLIVGYISPQDGESGGVGFALTPVPEPSTYAALAGVAALGLVAWRRRRA